MISIASLTIRPDGAQIKIDVHNHAMPERALDLLRRDPVYGVTLEGRRWSGGLHVDFEIVPSFVEPEGKLAELDSKGLDGAVVSVAPPLFYYHLDADAGGEAMSRATNQGLAEFCEADPGRLRWLATVPMQDPYRALGVLEEAVAAGAVGVEIGTAVAGRRLDEAEFAPFWSGVERIGVPVTLHPAYGERNPSLDDYYLENVLGFMFETTVTVERMIVAGVFDRHPRLRLVLVHGGGYFAFHAGRLRHARTVRPELRSAPADPFAYLDRLSFDIITHDPKALAFLIDRVGVDRVVMGTDLPFDMAPPDPMALLRDAAPDEATVRAVSEINPARLYDSVAA